MSNYRYYYTYMSDIYGVIADKPSKNTILVRNLNTDESEEVSREWLQKKIKADRIDIGMEKEDLEYFDHRDPDLPFATTEFTP